MKNYWKAGVLTATLVLPALLALMLHGFAENHYTLPYFVPKFDSTGKVLMNGKDTVFHQIPAFSLIDQNGNKATEQLTKGQIYLADFIFTRCTTICPKLTSNLGHLYNEFADKGVMIVSHSIDPDYDTPAVLKGYAQNHEVGDKRWYFLTGTKKDLYDLAMKGYFLPAENRGEATNAEPNQTISHSDKIVLVDKEGYIRGYYSGTDPEDMDRLHAELQVLLDIYAKK